MSVDYAAIRGVHVAAAATSLALFVLRAGWMLGSPSRLETRWVKVVPHVVDTALLVSALWLAWQLGAAGVRGRLAAKVIAVLVYIAAGTVALKRGRTRGGRNRAAAWSRLLAPDRDFVERLRARLLAEGEAVAVEDPVERLRPAVDHQLQRVSRAEAVDRFENPLERLRRLHPAHIENDFPTHARPPPNDAGQSMTSTAAF
jgi:uncharacterized membrane protein SirB2